MRNPDGDLCVVPSIVSASSDVGIENIAGRVRAGDAKGSPGFGLKSAESPPKIE